MPDAMIGLHPLQPIGAALPVALMLKYPTHEIVSGRFGSVECPSGRAVGDRHMFLGHRPYADVVPLHLVPHEDLRDE